MHRSIRRAALTITVAALAFSQVSPAQTTAPYSVLDNVEGPYVHFNWAPVRPIATVAGSGVFYCVNTHAGTVERFGGASITPTAVWAVGSAPVAIDRWVDGSVDRLVVVCRGSNALFVLERSTGETVSVVRLPAEPGDVLVDPLTGKAYVSCSAVDEVVEVDLATETITRRWNESLRPVFRLKNPLFLSFDRAASESAKRLLVAPLYSGNNSTGDATSGNNALSIVDLDGQTRDLPDEDLFSINLSTGTVARAAHKLGTILFAHGVHPQTGTFWALNTDANNKNPAQQSEPLVRGDFVRNRIARIGSYVAQTLPATSTQVSLDPPAPSAPPNGITVANTVGQPYALGFAPNGDVLVAGLLTDNILRIDDSGTVLGEIDLPAGSIPRCVVFGGSAGDRILVYCWGTNEVRAFKWPTLAPAPNIPVHTLSHDPTPPAVAAGREIFYDGAFSDEGNASCASCHVEGRTDMLLWNLSNLPFDDKGPMVTQTLAGLEKLAPFHWRGERQLANFNGAFVGLLGGPRELDAQELADFEAFVFSIQNPANPNQNAERVVDSTIVPPLTPGTPDAIVGQTEFLTNPAVENNFTCHQCHMAPSGTVNDIHPVFEPLPNARRTSFKPAPFHELWRKQMSSVVVSLPGAGPSVDRPFLGIAFSHTGKRTDLHDFIVQINGGIAADVTSFVWQWDQGIAPAVHYAFLLDAAHSTSGATSGAYLHGEATKGNCDIVVQGTSLVGSVVTPMRWSWDETTGKYRAEDPALASRSFADFLISGNLAVERNVFLGLPVGTGDRFSIDHDGDGIENLVDPNLFVPEPADPLDTTAPALAGTSSTVQWTSAKVARLAFETNEPVTAVVEYREITSPPGAWSQKTLTSLSRRHSVVLNDLRPTTTTAHPQGEYTPETVTYEWRIDATDRSGNSAQFGGSNFSTAEFIEGVNVSGVDRSRLLLNQHTIDVLAITPLTSPYGANNSVDFRVDVSVRHKRGDPALSIAAADRVVFGNVFVGAGGAPPIVQLDATRLTPLSGTNLATTVSIVDGTGITPAFSKALNVPGPHLASDLTNASGLTTLHFTASGLATGDVLHFNVTALLELRDVDTVNLSADPILFPTDHSSAFSQWDFPTTTEARALVSATVP